MRQGYSIGNRKVAIVGTGFVGSSIAYALALKDVAREIVLIDRNKEKCIGEAKDIRHGLISIGTVDLYAGDYSDCSDCDLIILTVGRNRQPGETRLDLAMDNAQIMKSAIEALKPYYTRGCLLVISNPVDILTQKVSEWMELPNGMVFGSGCVLDTSRFIRTVADYLNLSTGVVNGYLVGEHGEYQVPIWSRLSVGGLPIEEYCSALSIPWHQGIKQQIADTTRMMGTEIIKAKGKTHYGIATCVCQIADAVINQRATIISLTSPLLGEHGVKGVSLSVPSVLGPTGVQQRIREKWTAEEYRGFFDAVGKVREILEDLKI